MEDLYESRVALLQKTPQSRANSRRLDFAARLAIAYLLFAVGWILGSDWLVTFMQDNGADVTWMQSAKGIVFVSLSALLLFFAVHIYVRRLAHACAELESAWDQTLLGWAKTMDAREPSMARHSERVSNLTVLLAERMHVKKADLTTIHRGALLHDIGKIGVPDAVLTCPGELNDEQWLLMRKHPDIALHLLESIDFLKDALDIPYCHHERWNGSGYPRGLAGKQIPLWARMFAVVDVFDAVTSDRPYRSALNSVDAVEMIQQGSGIDFDPEVVSAFAGLMQDLRHQHSVLL